MRHWMIAALLGFAPAPAMAQQDAAMPGWMAGAWCTDGPATDRVCEYWTPESGGLMLGAGITMKRGRPSEWEQTRIARDGAVPAYFASPNGAPAVEFRAVASDATSITFENRGHDYPQRIRYWREGDLLIAEISLADGGKPMRWTYRRTGG